MKIVTVRLRRGSDLLEGIESIILEHRIEAGVLLSAVGCLSTARFRLADGISPYEEEYPFEILSVHGTVAMQGSHLHICLCDQGLRTIGGHLLTGSIVNTTVEIVIGILPDVSFRREMDEETGYKELCIMHSTVDAQ